MPECFFVVLLYLLRCEVLWCLVLNQQEGDVGWGEGGLGGWGEGGLGGMGSGLPML